MKKTINVVETLNLEYITRCEIEIDDDGSGSLYLWEDDELTDGISFANIGELEILADTIKKLTSEAKKTL